MNINILVWSIISFACGIAVATIIFSLIVSGIERRRLRERQVFKKPWLNS